MHGIGRALALRLAHDGFAVGLTWAGDDVPARKTLAPSAKLKSQGLIDDIISRLPM